MKEKPILFSAPMVQAILDGRKTQTRRVINPQPTVDGNGLVYGWFWACSEDYFREEAHLSRRCPVKVGDTLWVRECFYQRDTDGVGIYAADNTMFFHYTSLAYRLGCRPKLKPEDCLDPHEDYGFRKKPSIHLPRWAARIFLNVTAVRAERIQEISEADCYHEGIIRRFDYEGFGIAAIEDFASLWDSVYDRRGLGWSTNPWVWVYEFKQIEQEKDSKL